MGKIVRWRRHDYHGPIQYVFDRMTKGAEENNSVFEMVLKEGAKKALDGQGIYRDGWLFQNKAEVLPLQAADFLAWEALHYMLKVYLPDAKERERRSYRELNEVPMDAGFHNRETQRDWLAHVKEREAGRK